MIRIDIKKSVTHIEEVMVTGHGGAREGSDIVCAAVSAVTQTALAGLLYHLEGNVLHKKSKGRIFIRIPPQVSGPKLEISQIILSTMLLGLEQIAGQYPEKIQIHSDGKWIKPGTPE